MSLKLLVSIAGFIIFCLKSGKTISGGKATISDKPYMVYLLRSGKSHEQRYTDWLCGGAIVSPSHILTSAACLTDVTHLYAIAATKKYLPLELIDTDECIRNRKQRIIKTCLPKTYNFSYAHPYRWMSMDIGFAIVEKPYNFSDLTYRFDCDYVPQPIPINYDPFYARENTTMLILGWGYEREGRRPVDMTDYNSPYLLVAHTQAISRDECMFLLRFVPNFSPIVMKYLTCTKGSGFLDAEGQFVQPPEYTWNNGCDAAALGVERSGRKGMYDDNDDALEGLPGYDEYGALTRQNYSETVAAYNKTEDVEKNSNSFNLIREPTRRGILCVNDHGGPLVTWVGAKEVLVGVAASASFDKYLQCADPSLFTSTSCTMRFMLCALQYYEPTLRRRMCQNMEEEIGFTLNENTFDWSEIGDDDVPYDSYDSSREIKSGRRAASGANKNHTSSILRKLTAGRKNKKNTTNT